MYSDGTLCSFILPIHMLYYDVYFIITTLRKTVYETTLKRFTLQSYSEDRCLLQFILSVRNLGQVCRSGVSME